jgi:hypothetical protein
MRCRHRLSKLLLRHGIRFDDGRAWTDRHRAWLATITLDWPAAQATMIDAQGAIDAFCHRREALEREIIAMLPACPWAVQVGRLRCLRGIDTLSAVGLYSGLTRSHPSRTVLAAGRVYRSRHEDDLPVAAVLFGKAVSLSSFGQRNGLRNPGQQRASRHHLHKLPEGFGVLLDEHRSLSDPATGIVGDRPGADDRAPVSDGREHLRSDRHRVEHMGEGADRRELRLAAQDLLGTQRANPILVVGSRHGGHAQARGDGELDGEGAHRARGPGDQDLSTARRLQERDRLLGCQRV